MVNATKSGNITIKLGPYDVKQILENPVRRKSHGYMSLDDKLAAKIYKATSEKFTNVKAEMAQANQVSQILIDIHNTPERDKALVVYNERRLAVSKQHQAVNDEFANTMEKLIQTAFDKAGITEFVAHGTYYQRVVKNDTR